LEAMKKQCVKTDEEIRGLNTNKADLERRFSSFITSTNDSIKSLSTLSDLQRKDIEEVRVESKECTERAKHLSGVTRSQQALIQDLKSQVRRQRENHEASEKSAKERIEALVQQNRETAESLEQRAREAGVVVLDLKSRIERREESYEDLRKSMEERISSLIQQNTENAEKMAKKFEALQKADERQSKQTSNLKVQLSLQIAAIEGSSSLRRSERTSSGGSL